MVKELKEKYSKSQKDIAKLLGITQPSVSYYLHGERGRLAIDVIKNKTKETFINISNLLEKLISEKITTHDMIKEICGICMKVRPIYIQEVCPDKFKFISEWNVCFKE